VAAQSAVPWVVRRAAAAAAVYDRKRLQCARDGPERKAFSETVA